MNCCSRQRADLDAARKAQTDANLALFEVESEQRALEEAGDGLLNLVLATLAVAGITVPDVAIANASANAAAAEVLAARSEHRAAFAASQEALRALYRAEDLYRTLPMLGRGTLNAAFAAFREALRRCQAAARALSLAEAHVLEARALLQGALRRLGPIAWAIAAVELAALLLNYLQQFGNAPVLDDRRKKVRLATLNVDAAAEALRVCLLRCRARTARAETGLPQGPRYRLRLTGRVAVNPIGAPALAGAFGCGLFGGDSFFAVPGPGVGGIAYYHPFVSRGRGPIDLLEDLVGEPLTSGRFGGINHAGMVVGTIIRNGTAEAFRWSADTQIREPIPVGDGMLGQATGITDRGEVVGRMSGRDQVLIVRDGKVLRAFGDRETRVLAVNGRGDILCADTQGPYLREASGKVHRIAPLPGMGITPLAVGPAGHVVGYCGGGLDEAPFLWDKFEGTRELPGLGKRNGWAKGVNGAGEVVGHATYADGRQTAVLWPVDGAPIDLQYEISDSAGRFTLLAANCIDDAGNIAGGCTEPGSLVEGFLLRSRAIDWGVRVKVRRMDGTVEENFLVAVEADLGRVVLQRGLRVAEDGAVTVEAAIPLSTVSSIEVDSAATGFNLYFLAAEDGSWRTVELARVADGRARGTEWTLVRGKPVGRPIDVPIRALYGIPRVPGDNPTAREVKQLVEDAARNQDVPPTLMFALTWAESLHQKERWRQYARGAPKGCGQVTIVTAIGGVGFMQLAGRRAVQLGHPRWDGVDENLPEDVLSHLFRLSSDPAYNVRAGVQVLRFEQATPPSAVRVRRPPWFDAAPQVLEHWFFGAARYGGTTSYARRIWGFMATPPYPVPVEAMALTVPTVEAPPSTFPAHVDHRLAAHVDYVLPQPEVVRTEAGFRVTLRVTEATDVVVTGSAGIVFPEGYSQGFPLSAAENGLVADLDPSCGPETTLRAAYAPRFTFEAEGVLFYAELTLGDPNIEVQ